jgi:peptidoglycan/LPS O-acetylase OafA/YrhL
LTTRQPTRHLHIDALKFLASHLIVLHHLLAYGPISDALSQAAPDLSSWLFNQSRMAVQIFLVMGGYLAARALSPKGLAWNGSLLQVISQHYQKRVLPFLVAILLAIVGAALARLWLSDAFIPAAPTWQQFLAHALLLQGLLGQDALSAGIWYVAIDFQLFALMALLLWLAHKIQAVVRMLYPSAPEIAQLLVLTVMLSSLFFFNRHAILDNWALYFFGAYGLGAAAYWVGGARRPGWYLCCIAVCGGMALMLDFRERIAVAFVVALFLSVLQCYAIESTVAALPVRLKQLVAKMSQLSYALFLVHFVVLMLGNALFYHLGFEGPLAAVLAVMGIWLASLAVAHLFERFIERPLAHRGWVYQPGSSLSASANALMVPPVKLA